MMTFFSSVKCYLGASFPLVMSVAEMKGLVKTIAAGLVYLYRQASVEPV